MRRDLTNTGNGFKLKTNASLIQAAKASLATHTTVAELVKAKIDSEEFRPSLELEQFILEGGATDYLEQVKSC